MCGEEDKLWQQIEEAKDEMVTWSENLCNLAI